LQGRHQALRLQRVKQMTTHEQHERPNGHTDLPPETRPPPRYSDEEIQAWADACNACDNCLDVFDDEACSPSTGASQTPAPDSSSPGADRDGGAA